GGFDLLLLLARERVRTEAVHRSVDARLLEQRSGGGVVAVGVRDEDRLDGLTFERAQQALDVTFVARSGVDDGDASVADDVRAGAEQRERTWVVGDDA